MRICKKKLTLVMIDKQMTAKSLAEKSGVSRQTISNVKNGKSCIDAVGNAIAAALGVEVTELLED